MTAPPAPAASRRRRYLGGYGAAGEGGHPEGASDAHAADDASDDSGAGADDADYGGGDDFGDFGADV